MGYSNGAQRRQFETRYGSSGAVTIAVEATRDKARVFCVYGCEYVVCTCLHARGLTSSSSSLLLLTRRQLLTDPNHPHHHHQPLTPKTGHAQLRGGGRAAHQRDSLRADLLLRPGTYIYILVVSRCCVFVCVCACRCVDDGCVSASVYMEI